MKKRILLIAGLLAFCIAGQVMLGGGRSGYAAALDNEKITNILDTKDLTTKDSKSFNTGSLQDKLVQQFALMLLLVAVFGAGAWLFCRKMSGRRGTSRGRNITITETASLGPRKLLHIVRIGSKQFLLASTPENIRLLSDVTQVLDETDNPS
ncbi:MAG: flagellar biosynthetic protein FliO [Planctomycetaceae bacterium]|nr:flagellar biosynthetic protein FliO [Planctomycetaceae bacterium]